MRPKVTLLALISFSAVAAWGQGTPPVVAFPDAGEREVWVAPSLPTTPPTDSVRTGATSVEVPSKGHAATENVYVWDKKTGNLAIRPLKAVSADGTWILDVKSFTEVAQVKVSVMGGGKPVASADVSITDDKRSQSQLVDEKGEASFFGLHPGSLKVTVRYRGSAGMAKPVQQILDAPLSRTEPIPTLTIAVPDAVTSAATVPATTAPPGDSAPAPAPGAAAPAPAAKNESANPFGSLIVMLVSFGVVAGLVYGVWRYATQNPELVQGKLEQLGVQVPKPGDDAALTPAAPMPMPAKPAPVQKIVLSGATPDPAPPTPLIPASAPISVASAPVSVGEPQLISDTGDAMILPPGETVVGREVGLGLSLVGETSVSRRHAQLNRQGSTVTVKDLGSTNGTYVNGSAAQGDQVLRYGDTVQFGTVRFRFEG